VHPRGVLLDLICAVEWATDKSLFPLVAFIFFILSPGRLRSRYRFRATDSSAIVASGRIRSERLPVKINTRHAAACKSEKRVNARTNAAR